MQNSSDAILHKAESLLNFGRNKRLPVIVQTEAAECGLACLAMVVGYHGYDIDLMSMRRRFSVSSHGATLKSLMDIATRIELAPRALQVDIDSLDQVPAPCILHWGLNHFVVLKKITRKGYVIHDPAIGERHIQPDEFSKQFTGIVLELLPTHAFKKGEEKQTLRIGHFWKSITGLKRNIVQIIALSLLLQLFALITPFYMQTVVDDVILRKDTNLLMVLSIGFALLMLISLATSILRQFVVLHFTNRLGMQMSANLFRHLIRLPMDYFATRHMGDVVSRFGSLGSIREMITGGMVAAVVDGVMASLTLVAMFIYNWQLTLIVLGAVLIYALLRWVMYRPFKLLNEEVIVAGAKEDSHFMESIRAIQTVKLFQKEGERQQQWQNHLADVMNKDIRIARWEIGYSSINSILFGVENILVVFVAATAVMNEMMSVGMLFAFMAYKTRFSGSINGLIDQWIAFKMLNIHLDRLADIVHTKTENIDEHIIPDSDGVTPVAIGTGSRVPNSSNDNNSNNMSSSKINGKIEVRNLSYRYAEHEPFVLDDVSFTIEAGETVAITGPSGCGKTTLIKCMMGLIQPTSGEIFIDGKPLNTVMHYRSQIASVMQDDQLMAGDISENIACFDPKPDLERVEICAQMSCINNDIEKMSMGYHTLVGDMGTSLSGGQKQRIILARSLYREPRILFMDEATSNLDIANEREVNENIRSLDITRIIVAHRPETIQSAKRQIKLA